MRNVRYSTGRPPTTPARIVPPPGLGTVLERRLKPIARWLDRETAAIWGPRWQTRYAACRPCAQRASVLNYLVPDVRRWVAWKGAPRRSFTAARRVLDACLRRFLVRLKPRHPMPSFSYTTAAGDPATIAGSMAGSMRGEYILDRAMHPAQPAAVTEINTPHGIWRRVELQEHSRGLYKENNRTITVKAWRRG